MRPYKNKLDAEYDERHEWLKENWWKYRKVEDEAKAKDQTIQRQRVPANAAIDQEGNVNDLLP